MPRPTLLAGLVEEVEQGDSETKLYASLLARKLIGDDFILMGKYGRRIAELTMPSNQHKAVAGKSRS
jgi:hypothetical protein